MQAAQSTGNNELIQELSHAFRHSQHKDKRWSEDRDHSVVLQLPVNINELGQKSRCMWVKKQYKLMAKKWHPDKAKGDKKRASRKMSEVAEAKKALVAQFQCRGVR